MPVRAIAALILLGLVSAASYADSIDIGLSNDAAQFSYTRPYAGDRFSGANLDFGLMYTEDDDYAAFAGLGVKGEAGSESLGAKLGVGGKLFAVSIGNVDALALALGVGATYTPPAMNRLHFGAEAYFAPDIVTTSEADSVLQIDARIGYEILPQAMLYVGYRNIRVEAAVGPKVDLENGGFIGIMTTWY